MTDSLENAISDLKKRIAEHVAALRQDEHWREVQKLYTGLGVLEGLCGQPTTSLAVLLGISGEDSVLKIENWEFAGQPPLEAAKKYLKMIAPKRKAAPLDEIVKALDEGGLKASRDELRISLSRSTYEVYKVSDDVYGLLEFFPHVREKRKKKAAAGEVPDNSTTQDDAASEQLASTGTEQ